MRVLESVFLFVFLVGLGACIDTSVGDDDLQQSRAYAGVEAELVPHFEAFEAAARERGHRINLQNARITGRIVEISEDHVAGRCSYGGSADRDVTIDKSFWNRASHAYREYIVFHELGHCFLGRGHREGCRANHTYLSMMRSGVQQDCVDRYNAQTRDYYLDELFEVLVQP